MKLLDRLGWNRAVELITYYDWIIENGKTIDDLRKEISLENERAKTKTAAELDEYISERRLLKDKGINTDWCEDCDRPLIAIESPREECETELKCLKCGKGPCLDISLADYNLAINNKMYPEEEIQINPEENKVSIEERKRRRNICMSCEYLNGKVCRRCGCSVKHRTYYEILSCPDGRW